MISVNVIGGLGNQMFQYAFGRALSLRMGYQLRFDVADFQWYSTHEGFQLARLCTTLEQATEDELKEMLGWQHHRWARRLRMYKRFPKRHTIVEPHFHFSRACSQSHDGNYFVGYWHSHRYFEDFANEIRRDFCSTEIDLSVYGSILKEIESSESVGIHVRRGDYVSSRRGRKVLGTCGAKYYSNAIALLQELVSRPKFFVFSDQPSAVMAEQLVSVPHSLVDIKPRPPAYVELRMMARCKHFIIANSSFSWWAAWLGHAGDKRVIAPGRWFADKARTTADLIPPDWLVVE